MIQRFCPSNYLFKVFNVGHRLFSALLVGGIVGVADPGIAKATEALVIGTGSPVGVYDQVGKIVCRYINDNGGAPPCKSVNTGGSLDNIAKLRLKTLDAAVIQSDWQFHAYKGTSKFAFSGAVSNLRSLFSLYVEPLTVIARGNSDIAQLDDLPGHVVNIGNEGSGHRATMEQVMIAKSWNRRTFIARDFPASVQADALCNQKVDAIVFMVGHPNKSVRDASDNCRVNFVSLAGPEIDKLVADNPFYAKTEIMAGTYRGQDHAVPTFGVVATLVATTRMDEDTAYKLVKAVFENLNGVRQASRALVGLDAKRMAVDGLSAPLHPGALRYFQEVGLVK